MSYTDTTVRLAWDAALSDQEVTSYSVYLDGTSLTSTSNTTVAIINLSPNTQYTFTVTATDTRGNTSAPSNAVTVTTSIASTPEPYPDPGGGAEPQSGGPLSTDLRAQLPLVVRQPPLPTPTPVPTNPPPDAPADTYYVRAAWEGDVDFDPPNGSPTVVPLAYRIGYNAEVGSPDSHIILDFGRQYYKEVEHLGRTYKYWHVGLPLDEGDYDMEWARKRIAEYLQGYQDGHPQQASVIAIGTNNSVPPWECNGTSGQVSENWNEAGRVWGQLVREIIPPAGVTIYSANDIESWNRHFPEVEDPSRDKPWVSCGIGTLRWFDGYENQTVIKNINFGSHARAEVSGDDAELRGQWNDDQLFRVSYGRDTAVVSPQMYCDGNAIPWVDLREEFPPLGFVGVTADDNPDDQKTICPSRRLHWRGSWLELESALTEAGYRNHLRRSVSAFNYNR